MAKFFEALNPEQIEFVARQKIFFVASAPNAGRVNLSPKGMDSLRVLGPKTVAYLDLTGSSAETAAHIRENGRLTLMFCAFDGEPLILRLYGQGEVVRPELPAWAGLKAHFPDYIGARQIVLLHVDSLQTSCGAGVPLFGYAGERSELLEWAEKKGAAGLREYRQQKNRLSIDGLPTGLGDDQADAV
ncbi:MAG: pyridoxamine 5'-phosphate oxidase family protein [Betaproteobacteria bacterium]|nr:pyridoxamine 5'-phosphate oxidase family protein [Betaproteobacteria bacterium]